MTEKLMAPLEQAREATEMARAAFESGDLVAGIAAITLAAQLVQLAKIWTAIRSNQPDGGRDGP